MRNRCRLALCSNGLQLRIWCGVAFDVIANCVQFLCRRITNDIDGADFGSIVGEHDIFAQQFNANVSDEYGNAGGQHANNWIVVDAYNHPGEWCRYDDRRQQYYRFGPVIDDESLFPVQPASEVSTISNFLHRSHAMFRGNVWLTCWFAWSRRVCRIHGTSSHPVTWCSSRPANGAGIRDALSSRRRCICMARWAVPFCRCHSRSSSCCSSETSDPPRATRAAVAAVESKIHALAAIKCQANG